MADYTIAKLAQAAQVHVETVRYYQRKGLMREPARPAGGTRHYGDQDLAVLRFIKKAQSIGFRLDEIGLLLGLEGGMECGQAQEIGLKKLADIRQRLADLKRMEAALMALVTACDRGGEAVHCPLIDALRD